MPLLLTVIFLAAIDAALATTAYKIMKAPYTDEELEFMHLTNHHPPLKTE